MHVALGDTTKKNPKEAKIINIAADIRINAFVYKMLSLKVSKIMMSKLFTIKFYQGNEYEILQHTKLKKNSKYYQLHKTLYTGKYAYAWKDQLIAVSEESIRNTIKQLMPVKNIKSVVLLGSHDNSGKQSEKYRKAAAGKLADEFAEIIKEIGDDGGLQELLLKVIESNRTMKLDVLRKFAQNKDLNQLASFFEKEEIIPNVIPLRPSKADLAQVAVGRIPIFWHNKQISKETSDKGCGIYLDVSGSLIQKVPSIIGLLRKVKGKITLIYTFSTEVHEQTITELLAGKVKSTGGTDFDCIAEHAIEKKHSKFIVITDGYAGLSAKNHADCKKHIKDVAVILTSNADKKNPFSTIYNKTFYLDKLTK